MPAILAIATGVPTRAQEFSEAIKRGIVDDATLTVHLRSYYFDRTNGVPPNNVAWAGGGWIGYQSGWVFDALRVGAVGYTSQPLVAPFGSGGTLLLEMDQRGYTVLGQAYATLKFSEHNFTAYRQLIDQPEVNPQDNRMTPNTFEAYVLRGALGRISYLAGYVDKEKTRDSDEFVSMAKVAGAPEGVSEGMWLGGLAYTSEGVNGRLSSYLVPDILTSGYGDIAWFASLNDQVDVRLGGQFMVQGSNGANLLTGIPFSTWAGGLEVDIIWKRASMRVGYTQTGSAAAWRSPYGAWPGYTHLLVRNFDRANEGALLLGGTLDFGAIGLPGLAFSTSVALGNGAIVASTGMPLSTNNEYDFTVDYFFANGGDWPDWLKPIWLRARAGLLDQHQPDGSFTTVRDYRVILNYELKFGGRKQGS